MQLEYVADVPATGRPTSGRQADTRPRGPFTPPAKLQCNADIESERGNTEGI